MRSRGAMRDQTPARNALRAASTAASISFPFAAATEAIGSPVAGLMLSKRSPSMESTNTPLMKSLVSTCDNARIATDCQFDKL
jgi:hypothetical protein